LSPALSLLLKSANLRNISLNLIPIQSTSVKQSLYLVYSFQNFVIIYHFNHPCYVSKLNTTYGSECAQHISLGCATNEFFVSRFKGIVLCQPSLST
jgi:hypothetical protein